jgi:Putative peptidoglycan binding domain
MFSWCALHSPDRVDAAAAGKLWSAGRKVRTANERKITTMSTPTTTPTAPTTKSTGWIVATVVAAGLALAGIVAALLFAFGAAAHASKANAWDPSNSSAGGNNSPFRPNPPAPPVRPSATIKLLQEQLGQLNYYNGPVTGYMNHGTVQAIMYLQRDAHLPQTGQLNTATENALNSMLAGGNNHMGGNTNNNQMNANN